ncbi:MAG: hypothetical protein K2I96_23850 [Lachnospiraceae bacterium]|nr:hypothetical protein [Lachnospiraceae bacterium]
MNKRKLVFAVLIILTIIISLYGIGYMNFRVKELQGKHHRETDTDTLSEYSNIGREDEGEERIDERAMPKMVDIIINDQKTTILCEDGSVWSCLVSDDVKDVIKLPGLENITKILCGGPAMYALSESGRVYAWGSNEWHQIKPQEDADKQYDNPVLLAGLSDIVDIGVNVYPEDSRCRCFAIDTEGKLYVWGIHLYWDTWRDYEPGFPERNCSLTESVERIFIGAGNNHYFVREDKTIFSIMDAFCPGYDLPDFIYPYIGKSTDDISTVDLNEGAKFSVAILCEVGSGEDVLLIGADKYTMFLYKGDNTLWYWDSKTVEYHDYTAAIRAPESGVADYHGEWKEIDFKRILRAGNSGVPKIVDICAGAENVLFLTDDGQVFISGYETREVRDVECYQYSIREWNRIQVIEDLPIKTIALKKLDWENVTRINTDGVCQFTAVDGEGKYYFLNSAGSHQTGGREH